MNSNTKIEEVDRIIAVYRNYDPKLEKWSDKNIEPINIVCRKISKAY